MINEKTVSLCMVVYNDSQRVEKLVEHMRKHLVDEIVIVDQGSDENHSKVLRDISDVYHKTTNKGNADFDRQFCYSLASSEFIMAMDSDEWIDEEDIIFLKSLKYNYDVVWFLFKNTIKHNDVEVDLSDLLADDPHPRFWRKMLTVNGQQIPTLIWTSEAHKFPTINSDRVIFSQSWFQHKRFLTDVVRTHLSRGLNINLQAQQIEKTFITKVIEKFDKSVKKELIEQFSELGKYINGY